MNIEKCLRKSKKKGRKTVLITIRITPEISKWLRENNFSPTGIFYEALRELGYNENEKT